MPGLSHLPQGPPVPSNLSPVMDYHPFMGEPCSIVSTDHIFLYPFIKCVPGFNEILDHSGVCDIQDSLSLSA